MPAPPLCVPFLPIENPLIWADKIEEKLAVANTRENYAKVVSQAGYNAEDSAKLLEDVFMGQKENL